MHVGKNCRELFSETHVRYIALAFTIFLTVAAHAAEKASPQPASRQDLAQVGAAVENFLRREAGGLPGRVTIDVGRLDDRLALAPCPQLQTFFPAGSRAWGQTSVGVRCGLPAWTVYVPARVLVHATYLEAARPLAAGQEIRATDIVLREGEVTQLPAGVLTEPSLAVGRKLSSSIRAGMPLRSDALREPPAVHQGQQVALVVSGPGFRVSAAGTTLCKAPEGNLVQVRTAGGTVVSGIVRPGPVVEVAR